MELIDNPSWVGSTKRPLVHLLAQTKLALSDCTAASAFQTHILNFNPRYVTGTQAVNVCSAEVR